MLLYISGSYPANQEGIAAGAKVLLEAIVKVAGHENIVLLTTDIPVIRDYVKSNESVQTELMKSWYVTIPNIKRVIFLLNKYKVDVIHMEYPGDCYGKTMLASFLPLLVKIYSLLYKTNIEFNVRLHEFSRARLLRKIAIVPIALFANRLYIPALHDRKLISRIAGKRVKATRIGTNIAVYPVKEQQKTKILITYFGGVYPGKGIKEMFTLWKEIHRRDSDKKISFKIIGELNPDNKNHFASYHKEVFLWLEEMGLTECVEITGYVSDEAVSHLIQNTDVATVLYEDGLTLRRGSFIAYLAHGIPVITSTGDDEAARLLSNAKGVFMSGDQSAMTDKVFEWVNLSAENIEKIMNENKKLAAYFSWDYIARGFLKDYGMDKSYERDAVFEESINNFGKL